MNEKGLWLIDAGYLFNARRSVEPNYEFDYLKIKAKVEESEGIWRTYYLNSTPNPPSDKQNSFHTWLSSGPPHGPKIITKLYQLKNVRADRAHCTHCDLSVRLTCPHERSHHITKWQQKGVDVGIATLALVHQDKYDTLILSSGDGDLLDAVEFLSESGKRIVLVVFKNGVSTDLQARADEILWLDDFADDIKRDHVNSAQPQATPYVVDD